MTHGFGRLPALVLALSSGLVLALAGCRPAIEGPPALAAIDVAEDTRRGDPEFWSAQLAPAEPASVRRRAARAVGRLRDPALAPLLVAALDPDSGLDPEMLFALGQCGNATVLPSVREALAHRDVEARTRSVEAFGKLGKDAPPPEAIDLLLSAAADPNPDVRGQAWLALTRLYGRRAARPDPLEPGPVEALQAAWRQAPRDRDPGVRWRATYALAEIELPGRDDLLATAAQSGERLVRFFAVRGLTRLPPEGTRRLEALLGVAARESDPHILATALEALGPYHDPRTQAALRTGLARRNSPADHHVRRAAATALGETTTGSGTRPEAASPEVLAALRLALKDAAPAVRAAALHSLAALDPLGATLEIERALAATEWLDRSAAATALRALPTEQAMPLLERLARDPVPQVAAESLATLGSWDPLPPAACGIARTAVPSPDIAVRSGALGLLARCGSQDDLALVDAALLADPGAEGVEGRLEAIAAVEAIAGRQREALPRAFTLLDRTGSDPAPAVRLAVQAARSRLEGRASPTGAAASSDPPAVGPPSTVDPQAVAALRHAGARPRVVLRTAHGDLLLELFADEAPRHVAAFLERARAGFYDGLSFHRVVSGFVIQGLDPRGDGWGTGGAFLRDEINPIPYEIGTLGMPNSGPDTGGCQIFITHVPTPHLDGRYTCSAG